MNYRVVNFILLIIFSLCLGSCYKEPMDYTKAINDLKAQVSALQNRSDSLTNALKVTNTNVSSLSKTVDSIKIQLVSINSQLIQLNTQLTSINANITLITAQISALNQQYTTLLAQLTAILNQLAGGAPATLNTGLILFYPFNGNANDSSGNANNGTSFNVLSTSDRFGRLNAAFKFNGLENSNSSQVNCTKTVFNLGQSEYSIHLYFKPDNLSQITRALFNTIPHTGIGIAFNDNNAPGYVSYDIGPGSAFWDNLYRHGSNNNYSVGNWYSVTLIKNINTYSIYINGILEDSFVSTKSSAYNYNVGFRISGISDPSVGFQNFAGDIDDVRIYNRVLTPSEISYLASH